MKKLVIYWAKIGTIPHISKHYAFFSGQKILFSAQKVAFFKNNTHLCASHFVNAHFNINNQTT